MLEGFRRHWEVLRESLRSDRGTDARASAAPDFLPAALEILEKPPNPLGRIVLWVLVAFLAIALLWASLGRLDMVAVAEGKVIPRGNVKVIQPADYGVVRAIYVVEGESVAAGAPLIDLDPTVSQAEVEQARQALLTAQIDVARAQALVNHIDGKPGRFVPPAGTPAATAATQSALVQAKIREYDSALAGLREERSQRDGERGMIDAEVAKLEEQLPLASEQLAKMEELSRDNYVPRLQVSEVKERVVGMRQDLAIRREERGKANAAQLAANQQLAKTRNEFAREALDALTEADAARALRAEELKKAQDKADHTLLRAPVAGVVQQLQVHTIGGVVKPADPLMVVVPNGGELVVDAMVLNRDAGFVRRGQPVEVKLEAYPFTRYGVVDGVIETIGRDAIQTEKEGLRYPARVRLTQAWIEIDGKRIALAPGLAASAEIKTGDRRIIEYLLSPLSRRLQEAGRER
ncbi:HlyD family type I secretion periplasmic adaptor subunit [Lysobacter panacisoli]|uniref:Membrane fusion protein (MFP) family protein n=1 Tax=Lysobacter panacisoli TaxID=1255263 RepID=A0ABP9LPY3_9GAMM|nr:HlyD family type I secretion periplasmic adaptor subunit [Lysobacter panacisoli]